MNIEIVCQNKIWTRIKFHIDSSASIINCRRSMEFAIKWMYSVDKSLEMPYQDSLSSLMSTDDFHELVDNDLWKKLDLIRKLANGVAHNGRKKCNFAAKQNRGYLVVFIKNSIFFVLQFCENVV